MIQTNHTKSRLLLFSLLFTLSVGAQEVWDVDRCMDYAVKNNHGIRQREFELDNAGMDRLAALGSFLPGVSANTSVQYSYGRSIDPKTNTYNDVSTFYNNYGLEAVMPLFRGGGLVNEVRRSRAARLMGKAALQEARDNTALETFQAYIQALYSQGLLQMAREKLAESDSLLYKAHVEEELGLKGQADVAQIAAVQAADAYNLIKQQNLYRIAMLELKQKMNYPKADTLLLDSTLLHLSIADQALLEMDDKESVVETALAINPTLRKVAENSRVMKMNSHLAWSKVLPSINFFAGYSTSYFRQLHDHSFDSFRDQLRNNKGTYFGFSLSVPIFSRLTGYTSIRKAQNNYRIALEQYEEQKSDLAKLVEQAVMDKEGYLKEAIQMEKKEASDALAYHVTKRKYDEGLMTTLDLKNNAATWLESRANLLQSRFTYFLKCRLVEYYKGGDLIKNK